MLQRRWQSGAVYMRRGKKISMWYGRWWEDSLTADGKLRRRYRKIRLGGVAEIPTKNQARTELRRHMARMRNPR